MLPSDWLIENGWIPGNGFITGKGGCLLNAMGSTGYSIGDSMADQLLDALNLLTHSKINPVEWNDHQCPDAATAVAVMRQAEINCGLRPITEALTAPPVPVEV
jgi:hypothetical protein